jgi:hypothetical protein
MSPLRNPTEGGSSKVPPCPRRPTGSAPRTSGDIAEDASYVTTEWFIAFCLPLVPLGSFRVRRLEEQDTLQAEIGVGAIGLRATYGYESSPVPLAWRQIVNVYALVLGLPLALFFLLPLVADWAAARTHPVTP